MTVRGALLGIGFSLIGYIALIVVQLVWGKPVSIGMFVVALGGAFAGGFGYWYGEHRRNQ
jgi:hypothetical protein